MSVPKVFITQIVGRYDKDKQGLVEAFDFSAAAQYGALTPILELTDNPNYLARVTSKIRTALEDFTEADYLLAVGDPAVIAVCAGIILRRHDTVKLLKWDRKLGIYTLMEIAP